jgi:hypothetical protein
VCPFWDSKVLKILLKTARVFGETHFTKCFAKIVAKYIWLFHKTRGVVLLVSLFHEMARFGETCFAKQ